jgi:sugar lactone lactonase YvrE
MIGLPDGRLASWRNKQLAVSQDGGTTWRFVGPPMPYVPNGLAWSPAGDTFYAYRWTCNPDDNTTTPDSIIRLDTA